MNVLTRGVRNAFRNGIRTIAIVGMLGLSIGLSLAMLFANQAISQKISDVQKTVGNTITISPAGIRGFEGGGTPLTADQISKVTSTAHVTSVDETLTDRLQSSSTSLTSAIDAGSFGRRQGFIERDNTQNVMGQADGNTNMPVISGDFKPPITVIGSSNPLGSVANNNGSSATLTSGKTFDGTKDAQVALIGKTLATKNSLSVGSTFTAYGTTFTVAGIFDSGSTFSNNQVIMPLPTVQRLSSQSGAVTSATAHIDNATNLDSTTSAISNALGSNADVTNDATTTKATLSSLQNIKNVSLFSLAGAAGTAAVIILLTMIMIVRERRREIGVLKAIGGSNVRVMLQFVIEAVTLTVLAAGVGIIIGSVAATPVTKMLANNTSNSAASSNGQTLMQGPGGGGNFRVSFDRRSVTQGVKNLRANVNGSIVAYGLGGALLIAAVGSTAAAGLIAKVRPSEVMRAE
ncbi:MAG TPA: FtsX-like permease family protein [Candidatus Saccharimonadales bacterium]|nr:FtsX-like permease family protein [Candidatus Saccharimonadales bacterium]